MWRRSREVQEEQRSRGAELRAFTQEPSTLTLDGAESCRQWEGPVRLHLGLPLCAVCVVVLGMLDVVLLRLTWLNGLDPGGKKYVLYRFIKLLQCSDS